MKSILKKVAGLALSAALVFGMISCSSEADNNAALIGILMSSKGNSGTPVKETVATPEFSVASGAVDSGTTVTITCSTEGAKIYYTIDGTLPTEKSTKYSEAIEFTQDATIKAIAIKEGIENSPVSVATVSIKEKTITETKIEYVDKKADETAPANVTELTAQAKDSRILLTWKDAADSDIYGYEVSYSGTKPITRVVLPALEITSMVVPPKAGGTYINGLTNGTEYSFTVKNRRHKRKQKRRRNRNGNTSCRRTFKNCPYSRRTTGKRLHRKQEQHKSNCNSKNNYRK